MHGHNVRPGQKLKFTGHLSDDRLLFAGLQWCGNNMMIMTMMIMMMTTHDNNDNNNDDNDERRQQKLKSL